MDSDVVWEKKQIKWVTLWSFIVFSGVYSERSGKCRTGTRNWISECFYYTWRVTCKWMSEWDKCLLLHSIVLSFQRDHLKIAQQFFQLVGGSASECGTLNRSVINMILLEKHCASVCVYNIFYPFRHYSWPTVHGLLLLPLEAVWRCAHIS